LHESASTHANPEEVAADSNTVELRELQHSESQDTESQVLLDNTDSINTGRGHAYPHNDRDQDEKGSDIILQINEAPATEDKKVSESHNDQFWQDWLQGAEYLGINSSWRPCKHQTRKPAPQISPRSSQNRIARVLYTVTRLFPYLIQCYELQIISFIMITFGACLPAVFVSATNHTDRRKIGIGCRSLTWLLIMSVWVFNYLRVDRIVRIERLARRLFSGQSLNKPKEEIKWLWTYSLCKDGTIAILVTLGVLMVQTGFFNSCWCRSSFTDMVNLQPYSPSQWAQSQKIWMGVPGGGLCIILFLILWIEFRGVFMKRSIHGRERGSPLCKSQEQMQEEAKDLNER
jgi:hypothetical protein